VIGADYRFSPFTLAGFAVASGGTNFSIANGLGSDPTFFFPAQPHSITTFCPSGKVSQRYCIATHVWPVSISHQKNRLHSPSPQSRQSGRRL